VRSEVRLFPDPPISRRELCLSASALIGVNGRFIGAAVHGAVAQLGEHLLCKQGVTGSIPVSSTIYRSSLRQAESKRSRILVAVEHGVAGVLLRLFFCSLTIWNDPSIEVEYGFNKRRTVFFICPRLFGVIWSSE
jgi:hypothetical protein